MTNEIDRDGRNPIHMAAHRDDAAAVNRLAGEGHDLNLHDRLGFTPLHLAAQEQATGAIEALLGLGAEVDPVDDHGNTPLFKAVFSSQGRGDAIHLLLSHGADPDRENRHGQSPRGLAELIANYDVKQYFEASSAEAAGAVSGCARAASPRRRRRRTVSPSPFETIVDRLADKLGDVSRRGQVLLFASAAQAMLPSYARWHVLEGRSHEQQQLLVAATEAGRRFAVTGEAPADGERLLSQLESETPDGESDADGVVPAQGAWIIGEIAVRSSLGQFEPPRGAWYLLESQFQATSERLFGVTDVGSERQDEDEATALADPVLNEAILAVERSVDHLLGVAEPTDRDAAWVAEALTPLAPPPTDSRSADQPAAHCLGHGGGAV
jgi:uncharacterized protein